MCGDMGCGGLGGGGILWGMSEEGGGGAGAVVQAVASTRHYPEVVWPGHRGTLARVTQRRRVVFLFRCVTNPPPPPPFPLT